MGYNFQENTSTYVFNVTHVLIVNVNKEVKPAFGARLYCPECFFSSRDEDEFVAHSAQEHKLRLEQVVDSRRERKARNAS